MSRRQVHAESQHRSPESEVQRLQQENAQLRKRFDDLYQSAELWARLYERQLARANALNKSITQPIGLRTELTRGARSD